MKTFYPLKNYEGLYFISKDGTIKNKDRKLMSYYLSADNYHRITLMKDGKKRNHYIHILVCKQFIPNPLKLKEVDHINLKRGDNRVSNLRWTDRVGNCNNKSNNKPKLN